MTRNEWEKFLTKNGFAFREDQFSGVCSIDKTFSQSENIPKNLLMEAPPGSGKTLMYLGVAAIEKHRLLIATSGKLLQQQIAITWLHISGEEAAIVKGRSNYICGNMVEIFCHDLTVGHPFFNDLKALQTFLKEKPERDISAISSVLKWSQKCDAFIRNNLMTDSALCLDGECGKIARSGDPCAYDALLRNAEKKQIVITNHHALITIAGNNPEAVEHIFKGRMLVVDEAHGIVDAAVSVMTKQISSSTLNKLIADLDELLGETIEDVNLNDIFDMKQSMEHLLETLNLIPSDDDYLVFESVQQLHQIFCQDIERLENIQTKMKNISAQIITGRKQERSFGVRLLNLIRRYEAVCLELCGNFSLNSPGPDLQNLSMEPFTLATLYNILLMLPQFLDAIRNWKKELPNNDPNSNTLSESVLQNCYKSFVYYLQINKENKHRELKRAFISPQIFLIYLWNFFPGTAFVSATMTISTGTKQKEFEWTAEQLGFNLSPQKYAEKKLPSPFNLQEQCNIFIASTESVFKPSWPPSEPYLKACIHLTGKLIRAFQGRTLSLYTSNQRLHGAYWVLSRAFEELPACKLLAQDGETNKEELAEEFINNPETALLGTKSFFQGFNAPGKTLSCLILEKLPFVQRNDPILQARCRMVGSDGFSKVILPEMLMTLRQAFGRLIRTSEDRGIFVLADSRSINRTYKASVLDALEIGNQSSFYKFSNAEDLLGNNCLEKLSLDLDDPSDFDSVFEKYWKDFHQTGLFRQLTGINTLEDILAKFGIPKLHPWQSEIIDNVTTGMKEIFEIYPAGSGKSLTYQIPALLQNRGLTLVISPLVSLMFDQLQALYKKGFNTQCALLSGGMTDEEKAAVIEKISSGVIRLLYVTPERLAGGGFLNFLQKKVWLMVIDEAHMVCEVGPNFRPLYLELNNVRRELGMPQLMLITATAGQTVINNISEMFGLNPQQIQRESIVRKGIRLKVVPINWDAEHYDQAVNFVQRAGGRPVLIYALTIRYVESLSSQLSARFPNKKIRTYHTDLPVEQRNTNHLAFLNNEAQVMIATKAYGMGIDKPDIWGVLFNNIPGSLEEFVQGLGRICRNTQLLERYCGQGLDQVVTVQVVFRQKDIGNIKDWFINQSFQKTEECGRQLIDEFSRRHDNNELMVEIKESDDDFKNAWIGLAFLKRNRYIDNFKFDWNRSCFILEGIKLTVQNSVIALRMFLEQQKRLQQQKIDALNSVANFCRSKSCRNQFLQTYFGETDHPSNCYLCDNCPGENLERNQQYFQNVRAEMAAARRIFFRNGIFIGSDAEFWQEFERRCNSDDGLFKAYIGHLEHCHVETGLLSSDYQIMRFLLLLDREYRQKRVWKWNKIPTMLEDWKRLQQAAENMPNPQDREQAFRRIKAWKTKVPNFPLSLDDDIQRLQDFFQEVAAFPKPPYKKFSSQQDHDLTPIKELQADMEYFETRFGKGKELDNFLTFYCPKMGTSPFYVQIGKLLQEVGLSSDQGWIEWTNALMAFQRLFHCQHPDVLKFQNIKELNECFGVLKQLPKNLAKQLRQCVIDKQAQVPHEFVQLFSEEAKAQEIIHGIVVSPRTISPDNKFLEKYPGIKKVLADHLMELNDILIKKIIEAVNHCNLSVEEMKQIIDAKLTFQDFRGYFQAESEKNILESIFDFFKLDRELQKGTPNSTFTLLQEWLEKFYCSESPDWLKSLFRQISVSPAFQEILNDSSTAIELVRYYNRADNALLECKDFLDKDFSNLRSLFAEEINDLCD